jgi:hypothetical protein
LKGVSHSISVSGGGFVWKQSLTAWRDVAPDFAFHV